MQGLDGKEGADMTKDKGKIWGTIFKKYERELKRYKKDFHALDRLQSNFEVDRKGVIDTNQKLGDINVEVDLLGKHRRGQTRGEIRREMAMSFGIGLVVCRDWCQSCRKANLRHRRKH